MDHEQNYPSTITSASVIVPYMQPEPFDGLMQVVEGCKLQLEEIFDFFAIPHEHEDVLQPFFHPDQHLPKDILALFAVDADEQLASYTGELIQAARKRVRVLSIFLAEHTDADWVHDRVLGPQKIELNDTDCAVRVYDIPALVERPQSAQRTFMSIVLKTLENRGT